MTGQWFCMERSPFRNNYNIYGMKIFHGKHTMVLCLYLVLGILLSLENAAGSLDISECRNSLGMQSENITDDMLSASSSYDVTSVGPAYGRIRTEKNGGAWCPKQQISKSTYEYLQITFKHLMVLTLVETQGRFGNGQGQEFADQYLLEYQREPGGKWFRFRNRHGQEIFNGNTNTYIAELRVVEPPIIAKSIRFIPYSDHPRTVCMRVEVYGCLWKDGSIMYNVTQGEKRGTEVVLHDVTYDGEQLPNNYLIGGMGQLTDGEIGQTNFRLDPEGLGIKGYEWVGWRNESTNGRPIEMTFKFDAVRNFTSMRIHTNNMFSKDVRVFKMAMVYFSIGGQYFVEKPVEYRYMRDSLIEYARHVIIKLHHGIGQYVKVRLHLDSRWLLISEVSFESEYAVGNFTPEERPEGFQPTTPDYANPNFKTIHLIPDNDNSGRMVPDGTSKPQSTVPDRNPKPAKPMDDHFLGIIIGVVAALLILIFVVVIIIVIRLKKRKCNNNHRVMKNLEPHPLAVNPNVTLSDFQTTLLTDRQNESNAKICNGLGYRYDGLASEELDSDAENGASYCANGEFYKGTIETMQGRKLPDLPFKAETHESVYAVPDVTRMGAPPPYPDEGAHYAASDIVTFPNIQGVSGNTLYAATPTADPFWNEEIFDIIEFPRENLKFVEKLGEGQFGEVHLCEALQITEFLGDDFLINRTGSRSMLVAVKMLRRNVDQQAKLDFQKEVKIMSRLRDPNIVNVLAVCTKDEPHCVIVEYMKYGDLHQFLQQHVPENSTRPRKRNIKTLSKGCLIYMATQIASGMKFLENNNMVHRDLASRNCLVGNLYTIKISDFGMSRSLYSSDYYRIEGRAVLPIRWMAWESILLGKFSSKSDIWSFAVTLWEIFSFAKEQPFNGLSDEQVIDNCGHYFRDDGEQVCLPQPEACPKEIFDLMRECWNREESARPNFRDIHMFLQNKTSGYDPKEEKFSTLSRPSVPMV